MHIPNNKLFGEGGIVELSCEPLSLCSFKSLQSDYYSQEYLKKWSSQWVPSYCWSAEGLIADPIKTYLLTDAVILQDSYDIFHWSDNKALQCAPSYSSISCQQYSRSRWPAWHNPLLSYKRLEGIPVDRVDRIDSTLVFPLLWHRDHSNYWHFTFDIAFRLFYMLQVHPLLLSRIEFIVIGQNSLKPFQEQLLSAILGFTPIIRFASQVVQCKRAIFIPPVQTLLLRRDWLVQYALHLTKAFSAQSLEIITNNCNYHGECLKGSCQRLHIKRGSATNPRFLYNEAEVSSLLEKYGFCGIDPGSLSVAHQAHLFASADYILGLHGAAFVNIIFMKPHAHVIELTNQSYDPFHGFLLARQLDLCYQRLCTRDPRNLNVSHSPFNANLEIIHRCLKRLLCPPHLRQNIASDLDLACNLEVVNGTSNNLNL